MKDPIDSDTGSVLVSWLYDLPAAWMGIVFLVLMALGLWAALRALPFRRIVRALKTAPAVSIDGAPEGVVKVRGEAHPGGVVPEGYAAPKHVWRQSEKTDLRSSPSMRTTRTYSVAPILVRDATGECLIDPQLARVLPTQSNTSEERHIFSDSTYRSEKIIHSGDKVFAIGVLGRAKKRPGQAELPRCTLRPSPSGVLMLSGQSETRTLLRFQLRFWWCASGAFFCIMLALWGFKQHLEPYPEQSLTAYFQALVSHPWALGPGYLSNH